jgi:NitT/TauT family transport system permease protein
MRETAFPTFAKQPEFNRRQIVRRLSPFVMLLALVMLWQMVTLLEIYPAFILPPPAAVAERFIDVARDGTLLQHTWTTFTAVMLGLLAGATGGLALGYAIAKSTLLEDILSPLIVAVQATPIVAYAPLLVIWFGSGPTSKIVTSALIVFFPTLMNTVVGIRNVPRPLVDLMRVLHASRWQMLTKLEIPAALPVLLGGLKVSATLAVIGAVVGEFVASNGGLGFLINLARSQYDTPLVIVAVLTLAVMARLLYGAVAAAETRMLRWQQTSNNS